MYHATSSVDVKSCQPSIATFKIVPSQNDSI